MKSDAFVSIIMPCRNEEKYIKACLDSVVANDYPKDKLEILVVDGMSNDGTRRVVEECCEQYTFVHLFDNPEKITPFALNIGVRKSKGDVIIRMDAHAEYPSNFISKAMNVLDKTGADVVGGPILTLPSVDTLIARAIALITSHPFGVGDSKFRTSAKEGYVDTVPFGAYRREVFDRIGVFDECLLRNQDNEFHSRLIKAGGRIYLTPKLTARYYNQSTISGLAKQAFKTGMWNVLTLKVNPVAFRLRHFTPFVFVTAIMVSLISSLFLSGFTAIFLSISGSYGAAAIYSSLQLSRKNGLIYMFILPGIFFLYHVSYGFGTWAGLFKAVMPAKVSKI